MRTVDEQDCRHPCKLLYSTSKLYIYIVAKYVIEVITDIIVI